MARNNSVEITVSLNDVVTKGIKSVQSSLTSFKKNILSVQTAIAGVGLGLLVNDAIETASSFEQLETKLDALTKGNGQATLDAINEWAMDMPVNTQAAVDAFSMMTAMGLDPTIEKMETLVDTSTIFGEQTMPVVARALGQLQTLGKLSAEELNQLAEAGINARKYLKEAFGGKSVEEIQASQIAIEDIVEAIWDGLDRDFGGAAASAQTKWAAMLTTMGSYWTEFKRLVMDAGLFTYLKNGFKIVLDKVQELQKNGTLKTWAKEVSDSIIGALEKTILGVAGFVDAVEPAIKKVSEVGGRMWKGFKALPAWAQEVGVLGAMLGGRYGVVALAALSSVAHEVEIQAAGFASASAGLISYRDVIFSTNKELEALLKARGLWDEGNSGATSSPKGPVLSADSRNRYQVTRPDETAETGSATDAAQKLIASLHAAMAETGAKVKTVVTDTVAGIVTAVKSVNVEASLASMAEAELAKFKALQSTELAQLKSDLKNHLITVGEYYDKKEAMALEERDAEIKATQDKYDDEVASIKKKIEAESDVSKADELRIELKNKEVELNADLYTEEQEYLRTIIKLEEKRTKAIEEANEDRRKKEKLLAEIKQASLEDTNLETQLQTELEEIKSAHVQELDELRELGASKLEIEQAIADQTEQIRMQERDNERALLQQRLSWASGFAGNMADMFQGLAESGIGSSEKMFEAYKAFAIAQTIISTYSSAVKAYESLASIPYVGPVLGAAAAAAAIGMGMAKVAAIRASEPSGYAMGGLIDGPDQGARADNVTIKATPGEYMMDRPTVAHYGVRAMEALRQHVIPRELFSNLTLPAARPAYAGAAFAYGGQVGSSGSSDNSKQSDRPISIVNVLDPKTFDKYMASSSGQRTVLNVISQNQGKVNTILDRG